MLSRDVDTLSFALNQQISTNKTLLVSECNAARHTCGTSDGEHAGRVVQNGHHQQQIPPQTTRVDSNCSARSPLATPRVVPAGPMALVLNLRKRGHGVCARGPLHRRALCSEQILKGRQRGVLT
jgi:hypothetical protein